MSAAPRLTDLPPASAANVLRLAREQGLLSPCPRPDAPPTPRPDRQAPPATPLPTPRRRSAKPPPNPGHWHGKESDLQAQVNASLRRHGYAPRDKAHILGPRHGTGSRGWYIHVPRAIGNPYLLDVLVLANDGRFLELELKTACGQLSPIQSALHPTVCRSVDEALAALKKWESQGSEAKSQTGNGGNLGGIIGG